MPTSPPATTVGSRDFEPAQLFEDRGLLDSARAHLLKDDFKSAIITAFQLSEGDDYEYHATATVTLSQVQTAIDAGSAHGLHDWYLNGDSQPIGHPPESDISAYIQLFDPSKVAANSLKGFAANAKKNSLRAAVAQHLLSRRFVHASVPSPLKQKTPHANPYIDFLSYTNTTLESCGPSPNSHLLRTSHHVLPVLMHHFSCVCPTYEALALIASFTKPIPASTKSSPKPPPRTILDVGSGNGYWTYMLRRAPFLSDVIPIDNMQSRWRTTWVPDTLVTDAVAFLKKRSSELQKNDVLLMVYPVTAGEFTARVLAEFGGDVVCVVGTQNGNGYTGFKGEMVDEWFSRERGDSWELVVRVPVMSFPGKDDALFVFRRREG
jgi:hypothetical protein